MKIAIFSDGYLPQINGVATSVEASAKALEKLGHEVYIFAPKYSGFKDRKNVIRIPSVSFPKNSEYRLATFHPGKPLSIAAEYDFDIIHGHAGGPVTMLGWEVARIKNVPFVYTYHTLWKKYTHYVFQGKIIRPKMMEILSKIVGNMCDVVVSPTEKVTKELKKYGVKKDIITVPSGLDLSRYEHVEKGYLRSRLGIPQTTKILLYVGRLEKEKSIDFLIKALAHVKTKYDNVALVIVGGGSKKTSLTQLAKSLNVDKSVYFFGQVAQEDIPLVYKDADIFTFSSRSETQGLVVLEAMASGLPVVCVEDDVFSAILEHNVTGLVSKKSVPLFGDFVLSLLRDSEKAKELAKNARELVQNYSIETTALQLEKLYEFLLTKNVSKSSVISKLSKNIFTMIIFSTFFIYDKYMYYFLFVTR